MFSSDSRSSVQSLGYSRLKVARQSATHGALGCGALSLSLSLSLGFVQVLPRKASHTVPNGNRTPIRNHQRHQKPAGGLANWRNATGIRSEAEHRS